MNTLIKRVLPMPRLGETMDQGTIARWLVRPGEAFKRGDALLEVETDKTLVEYPALGDGRLVETLVETDALIAVGAPIAIIETADAWDDAEPTAPEPAAPEWTAPEPTSQTAPSPAVALASASEPPSGRLRATPKARRLARRRGADLDGVAGSGRRGRIEARDVPAAQRGAVKVGRAAASSALLFLHGLGGMGSNWDAVRAAVGERGQAAAAPDMPGHGRATAEAAGVDALIDWAEALLATRDAPLHLVGHSLGAHVAALAAARRPDRVAALTLLAPVGCGADVNGRVVAALAGATAPGALRHVMRQLGPKAAALPDATLAAMAAETARGRLTGIAADLARGDDQQRDTIAALGRLAPAVPVRAVFGLADAVVPREHVFNMPPQVACHVVRAGHMPHWDAPGLVARLIDAA